MIQSTSLETHGGATPLHVAIVLDGNGRWAERRGLPRIAGHSAGAESVRRIVEAAPGLGIGTLTLFAFSSDNWRRPEPEISELFRLLVRYLGAETRRCVERGVRLGFPGRRDRLPASLAAAMSAAEARTACGTSLRLRIAVDYSARDLILRAARGAAAARDREAFLAALAIAGGEREPAPEVDLFVRTGGERRLSDFLLFECAYAELEFLDVGWPDFKPEHLEACLRRFHARERRFGGLAARSTREEGLA
jgi:undecaprenyl diphosphate synthase